MLDAFNLIVSSSGSKEITTGYNIRDFLKLKAELFS